MQRLEITIVGAGIVGLAIGRELTKEHSNILILEKNFSFGQEISSRNSEVIHAGIYYSKESLKTKTCREGREMLYEFCANNKINHKKTGKLIVAINKDEMEELENLLKRGLDNGVEDLKLLSKNEIGKIEPNIEAQAAVYSPSTGILDSHGLMKSIAWQFESKDGTLAYNTEVKAIEKTKDGFEITVQDKKEGEFKFLTRILINSAGLNSERIAIMAGLANDEYRLKFCKGDYFRVNQNKAKSVNRLVYPVPKKDRAGLGIHATLDLAGGLRLGPDDEYVNEIDYNVDPSKREIFYKSVNQFLPFLSLEDLNADMAGIRPKLQGPGEDFRDFIIKEESDNGLSGLINLIGIESPGLTSSFSIAKKVRAMVEDLE